MIETYLRPTFDAFFISPVAKNKYLSSPNTLTFFAAIFGVMIIPAMYFRHAWLAIFLMLASGYFDVLDGAVARDKNRQSNVGSFLDVLSDRVVESSIIIGLFLFSPETRGLECLLMLTSILLCITVFLLMGIFSENETQKSFYYDPGIMERAEAFIFFGLMMLLPSHFLLLSLSFSVLVLLTVLQHVRNFLRLFR